MTFKKFLSEEWAFTIDDTKIFVDPTPEELYEDLRNSSIKEIRGIWDGKNFYLWNAFGVLHGQVEGKLKATNECIKYVSFYHHKDNRIVTYTEYPTDNNNKPLFDKQEFKKADKKYENLINILFKRLFPALK